MENKYFLFYQNCFVVSGYKRSIIVDLQYHRYFFIPKDMGEFLEQNRPFFNVSILLNDYERSDQQVILEYFNFLNNNELGCFLSTEEEGVFFPKMSEEWMTPSFLTNAIIDIDIDNFQLNSIVNQLEEMLCKSVFINIVKGEPTSDNLMLLLSCFNDKVISDITIALGFEFWEKLSEDKLSQITQNGRLRNVIVFNAPHSFLDKERYESKIHYVNTNPKSYYKQSPVEDNFYIDVKFFHETKHHNGFHNRKAYIDVDGFVYNTV